MASPAPHLPGRLHPLPQAEVEQDDDQHQAGGELPAGRAQVIDALALVEVQHAAPAEGGGGSRGLPLHPAAGWPRDLPSPARLGSTWPDGLGTPVPRSRKARPPALVETQAYPLCEEKQGNPQLQFRIQHAFHSGGQNKVRIRMQEQTQPS